MSNHHHRVIKVMRMHPSDKVRNGGWLVPGKTHPIDLSDYGPETGRLWFRVGRLTREHGSIAVAEAISLIEDHDYALLHESRR